MKNIFEFINKNKYIILTIMIYVLFFMQMQNVHLYADDYTVFNNSDNIIIDLKHMIVSMFNKWSGRLIGHSIVFFGIGLFGIQFFRLLHPIFVFLFCFLFSKIIKTKAKIDTFKLIFFLSLIIFGLDVKLNNQLLYWAYSGVLYLWSYVLMFVIIYFIFDCNSKNQNISRTRFIISAILIFVINFMMESTSIFICITFFLLIVRNIKYNKNDKRLNKLFMISILLLFLIFFFPGNLRRLQEEQILFNIGDFFKHKTYYLLKYIFFIKGIPNTIIFSSICICIKNLSLKKDKIISIFVLILNGLLIFNIYIYDFMSFNWDSDFVRFIPSGIYLLINIYLLIRLIDKEKFLVIFLVISGIITTIINVLIVNYQAERFFFILIIPLLMLDIFIYLSENKQNKIYILMSYIFILNYKIGIIAIILYFIFYKKDKIINLFLIIFCLLNLSNFFLTIYHYHQNSLIFEHNIKTIEKAKKENTSKIYLKKLEYPDYAFHMPERNSYVLQWYKSYYEIEDFEIIYE